MTDQVYFTTVIDDQAIDITVDATPSISVSPEISSPFTVVTVAGPPGQRGPAGTNTQIVGETPEGAQDGTNRTFDTAHAFATGSTAVYINGLREVIGVDYVESDGTAIIFTRAPLSDDEIRMDYLVS